MAKSLIEQWFPAATVGAESLRERGASSALPPVNFLHVWWARRPLTASRAAIVASLLPAWPNDDEIAADPEAARIRRALEEEFPAGERSYHVWFVKSLGILGDPVAGRQRIKEANERGIKLQGNGYGYDRAFTVRPDRPTVDRLHRLARLRAAGLDAAPVVLDPFAGGGSIPFEAARYGCVGIANELNPVAAGILNGTVSIPNTHGPAFAKVIEDWGRAWCERVGERLHSFFPREAGEDSIIAYVWAHTVPCPSTGHHTPLAPNYWLATGKAGRSVAVKLDADPLTGRITTTIVEGEEAKQHGDRSTYSRGSAQSVFDPTATFDGAYIQAEAQAGRMGTLLLAAVVSRSGVRGRQFRSPTESDYSALEAAKHALAEQEATWSVADLIPSEDIGVSNYDRGHRLYGISRWRDFFADRQLLTNVTLVECLGEVLDQAKSELNEDELRALALYLAFAVDKAVDYNSRQSSWHNSRLAVRNKFDKHNYAFKWTFAEFDGASALAPWALSQVADAYSGIAALVAKPDSLFDHRGVPGSRVLLGSAAALDVSTATVDLVVTDPPYYDNVMYAECSDYFYVWLKRALRSSWPELANLVLSDKENEAVANRALFKDLADPGAKGRSDGDGMSALELADQRYEQLLAASFAEAHRVLKDGGVMTVMFTHKRVDAWDTLGAALLNAGFEISSSWPVHTESEHSLHQAKKNSASSTILLGCRKRSSSEPAYWNDIRALVEKAAEHAAHRFSKEGIKGVDLTLATYGPALSVLSRNWPVYTGNLDDDGKPEVVRPDVALDLARERVAQLKKRELLGGRDVEFDRATDWWLLAWNDFQAAQFPAGEALKLCIATDLELDDVAKGFKLVKAASGNVTIQTPAQRRTARALDPGANEWPTMIDALHALMLVHDEDGLQAAERWLVKTGHKDDERFRALVEAALHAVPRAREKDGSFARPEARILESLRATLYDHLEAPDVEEITQSALFDAE